MLLSKGYLVYAGPVSSCGLHFESLGFSSIGDLTHLTSSSNANANPAEYLITLLSTLPTHSLPSANESISVTPSSPQQQQQQQQILSIESLANEMKKLTEASLSPSLSPSLSASASSPHPSLSSSIPLFLSSFLSHTSHSLWTTLQFIQIILRREGLKESRRYHFWLIFYLRAVIIGFAIGAVWYQISCEGFALLERLGLFLTLYLLTAMWMTEFIPSFHLEKVIFYRERDSNATNNLSSWLTFGLIHLPLLFIAILLLTLPVYLLADLNDGSSSSGSGSGNGEEGNGTGDDELSENENHNHGTLFSHYLIFSMTIYLGLIANLFLNHLLVYLTPNHMIHILLFPGVSLAIQSLLSGYAVLPSTISPLLRWVIYLNPCFLVMDSLFVNEFKHNSCADSFQNNYQYYEEGYSYTIPQQKVLWYLFLMISVHKLLGYFTMRWINSTRA
jgi:hypothetical protein